MNHNKIEKELIYDECLTRGICSLSPSLSYLHEIIKEYIREIAFYLLKLKQIGITNEKIKDDLIDAISSLSLNVTCQEDQFLKITTKLADDLNQAKELYTSVYKEKDLTTNYVKSMIKQIKNPTLSEITRQGQNLAKTLNIKINPEQKNWLDLMYIIAKSICVHLVELKSFDFEPDEAYNVLLSLMTARSQKISKMSALKEIVDESSDFDHTLLLKLQEIREERYGKTVSTNISQTTRANKAILVAGTNLKEMEMLLEATKDKNIDIYTHGHMLMAHTYPFFKKYPHLVGHFGDGIETYLLDFAAFPGAILLTRHSFYKVDSLYRSRIYTTDVIAPKGVVIIKNNNFEPLIESALHAKGFTKSIEKPAIETNLDEEKIIEKIKQIVKKVETEEIKNFFLMGVSNHTKTQREYFEKFLSLLNDKSFVLSFSYTNNKKNVLQIKSDYGFPLVYKTLDILSQKKNLSDLKIINLATRCEVHTIPNMIHMYNIGVKNIYFWDCLPTLVNPTLIEAMREFYFMKKYTTPETDLKEILAR